MFEDSLSPRDAAELLPLLLLLDDDVVQLFVFSFGNRGRRWRSAPAGPRCSEGPAYTPMEHPSWTQGACSAGFGRKTVAELTDVVPNLKRREAQEPDKNRYYTGKNHHHVQACVHRGQRAGALVLPTGNL